jgi:Arc/MetJ-type ribon-helix-helix transcriptional regulator
MAFFEFQKKIRINKDLQKKINELLQLDGSLENDSHVIRCAINYFYEWKKARIRLKNEGKID